MLLLHLLFPLVVFSQFSMVDGLSQNTVFSIAEDQQKNIWLATYNGVNRYDGYQFTVYHTQKDPDFVQVSGADQFVYVDSRGGVWAYDGGISHFEKEKNSFVLCEGVLSGAVTCMTEAPSGNIFIVTGGRMVTIDYRSNRKIPSPEPLASLNNVTMCGSDCGIIAIGTSDGHLIVYRSDDISLIDDFTIGSDGSAISDILIKSSTEIWVAAVGCGPVRIDLKTLSSKKYVCGTKRVENSCMQLAKDSYGTIYAAAAASLFRFDVETDKFSLGLEDADCPKNILNIHFDTDDGIWLGTYRSGVYYGCLKENPLSRVGLFDEREDFVICSITEGPDGKLWISTQDKGFFIYDTLNGKINPFGEDYPLLNKGVMTISFDEKKHKTYFGNSSGVSVYDWKSKKFSLIDPCETGKIQVYSFARENSEKIWVGTLSGLYLLDTEAERLDKIIGSEKLFIYSLLRDNRNILWIATSEGLYRTTLSSDIEGTPECGEFEKFSEAIDVHDLLLVDNNLLAAARNGLFIIDKDDRTKHYDISDGLSNNYLNGLEADFKGNIWLGTENGLNCFDPKNSTVSKYYSSDGTGLDYYTKNAHCRTSDGRIYWGGVNGLCCVDPAIPFPKLCSENPVITEVYVNDIVRDVAGNQAVFKYYENSIRFVFSVPNYSSKNKSTFYCRLCGLDEKWRDCGQSNSISWHSLLPGEYRFEMYSLNKNFVRSADTITFKIKILPPWYISRAAILIYAIIVIAGIFLGIRVIKKRERRKTAAVVEEVRQASRYEIDRLRLLNLTGRTYKPEDSEFLIRLLNVIEDNISNAEFSVENLASELCMSRSNLFLRVKNTVGDNASHLVRVIRLNKACQLMMETSKSIEEIALLTGYSSGASFSTSFRKEKGVSPQEWRK